MIAAAQTTTEIPLSSASRDFPRNLQFFHFLHAIGLLVVIVLFSIYIPSPDPKIVILGAAALVAILNRRLFDARLWPLVFLAVYNIAMNRFFPGPHPNLLNTVVNPGFQLAAALLIWVCFEGRKPAVMLWVMFGCLLVSVAGALGDFLGWDMTALLPISMPSDEFFDAITTTASGDARIRGFFPEASILGCVTVALSFFAMAGILAAPRLRRSIARWQIASIAGMLLLFFLGITLTKTGILILVLGLAGFLLVALMSGSRHLKIGACIAAIFAAGGLFLLFSSDTSLGSYLSEESAAVPVPFSPSNPGDSVSGAATRYKCWKLALISLKFHPFGVGHWGLGSTLDQPTGITPSPEMEFWFERENYSLKNALANIIAETGLIGIAVLGFWLYTSFLRPIRILRDRKDPLTSSIGGLYLACFLVSLAMLASCELYPYFAFILFLKLFADSVAEPAALNSGASLPAAASIG